MRTNGGEKLKKELLALQDKRGRLVPRQLWQWAQQHKNSELYKQFPWDKTKAAEAHWDDVARDLIKRYLTVTVVSDRRVIKAVAYVHDPNAENGEQSYISLTARDLDERDAEKIMLAELARCESAIERARGVAAVLEQRHRGISAKLEDLLLGLVDLAATFKRAA